MKFRKNVDFQKKSGNFHDFQKNLRFSRFSQMCPERYVSPNLINKDCFGEYTIFAKNLSLEKINIIVNDDCIISTMN